MEQAKQKVSQTEQALKLITQQLKRRRTVSISWAHSWKILARSWRMSVRRYSDEGISGTSTRRRDGFNRMVEDALAGRIGLILTKSVSRFARNTVDSLTTIRKLKEHGTEVYFEKENIWTFDSKGELLLTIMSSLAQEESRSISLNVTWGQRKRFADGKATAPFSVFLGYDRGENGEFVINPEQAEIVKIIYGEFLKGFSFKAIARKLTEMGIKSPKGKDVWNESTVKSILTNEKYKGCALLQKHYTADYLTKKIVRNDGAVPQYYVEDCHEAIIEPETFDRVRDDRATQQGAAFQRHDHFQHKDSLRRVRRMVWLKGLTLNGPVPPGHLAVQCQIQRKGSRV